MGQTLRNIIKNYPFAFLFFLIGGSLGVLIVEQLGIASTFYSQIKSPFQYDVTGGMLNQLIFVYPITIIIDLLCGAILGLIFSIFGLLIDLKNNRKRREKQEIEDLEKKSIEGDTSSSLEEVEKERLKLKQERLALEKERLDFEKKKKQDL